ANFWGVTFARDGKRFYASMGAGGETYLLAGDLVARTLRVLRENVECPSLSPDGKRIVFKKRRERGSWRLHVIDVTTLTEAPLQAEMRSIDDQVDWLDDGHIVYAFTN